MYIFGVVFENHNNNHNNRHTNDNHSHDDRWRGGHELILVTLFSAARPKNRLACIRVPQRLYHQLQTNTLTVRTVSKKNTVVALGWQASWARLVCSIILAKSYIFHSLVQ